MTSKQLKKLLRPGTNLLMIENMSGVVDPPLVRTVQKFGQNQIELLTADGQVSYLANPFRLRPEDLGTTVEETIDGVRFMRSGGRVLVAYRIVPSEVPA